MATSDPEVILTARLDDDSITRIVRALTEQFEHLGVVGAKSMGNIDKAMKTTKAAAADAAKSTKKMGDAVGEVTHDVERLEQVFKDSLSKMDQQTVKLIQTLQQIAAANNVIAASVRKSGTVVRQEKIQERAVLDAASRATIAEIKNEGKIRFVETLNAGVAAKQAAQHRIDISKQMFKQIILIEKALGTAIAAIARTTVSAFSKMASGISGAFARIFGSSNSSIKQLDRQMTTGLSGALKGRETMLRQSFGRQEQIVSRAAARQQAALAGMRTSTQTGVIGAANRSLNIGAWVGGAALLMAVRSTFTVGSEFTRGMAVLQAQLNLTDEAMKSVRQTSIDLGNDLTLPGVSALDASQAIQLLSKQFAALGEGAVTAAQDAAKGTLQLSRAAGVGAEEAAGIVGAAVNVFGIGADKAVAVADQVTAALKNAAGVSFGDFSDAFKQAAAVFAQFQVPAVGATEALVQFDAALAVIARQGVVGSDAGTSLKQFFLQANRGTKQTEAALAELTKRAGETGTAFYDAAGKSRPLEETLKILRTGLKGYTDEQRNSALQTIFGSDAIRVANALLNTSAEEYSKMVNAMREQGLAAKIAAAQNTGLKGAMDALKSVVETVQIILYEKVNPILADFTLAIASAANAIFFGEGAFEILRKALIGMAIGMGAVLAAKGAVEVIQLLGTAAKLALTPFGALLVAAGLLGAAFAVLYDKSEPFKKALSEILLALQPVVEFIKSAASNAFSFLGDLFTETVIPALEKAAVWLAERILPAFKAVRDFVMNTFIPAVVEVAGVVADTLAGAFEWALKQAKAFWHFLQPILQPMIEGFHDLVNAIGAVFSDWDFSKLRQGAANAVAGVATTAGIIVAKIGSFLAPIARSVFDFFKELFSPENIKKFTSGFLAFVEEVGRILGLIVSDPRLYKVIAAVAAAAAIVAFRFVKGFIGGIIENLPELWALLTSALKAGFKLVFDNLGLVFLAVFAGVGLYKAFTGVKNLFTEAGKQAGGGFLSGFKTSMTGAGQYLSTLMSGTSLTKKNSALASASSEAFGLQNQLRILGGSTAPISLDKKSINAAKNEVLKLRAGLTDAQYAALKFRDNVLLSRQAFGSVVTGIGGMVKAITIAGGQFRESFNLQRALSGATGSGDGFRPLVQQAYRAFNGIRDAAKPAFAPITGGFKEIGKSAVSGWTMARVVASETMDKVKKETRIAFGGVASGMLQIGKSAISGWTMARVAMSETLDKMKGSKVAQFGAAAGSSFSSAFTGGFKAIGVSFAAMMEGLRTVATEKGTTVGKMIGSAIGSAAIGAAATVGGFVAGKAEGSRGGSGLLSAILGGVSAGAMIGGPWGAAVGAITGGAALIGAAMGRAEAKAKEFRAEVKRLAEEFSGPLVDGVKEGTIALSKLDGMSIGVVLSLEGNTDVAVKNIADGLSEQGRKALADVGLNIKTDIIPMLASVEGNIDEFRKKFTGAFIAAAGATDEFKNKFTGQADVIKGVLADIAAPGGARTIEDWLGQASRMDTDLGKLISSEKKYLNGLLNTTDAIGNQSAEIVKAVEAAQDLAAITEAPPGASRNNNFFASLGRDVATFGDNLTKAQEAHATAVDAMTKEIEGYNATLETTKALTSTSFVLPNDTSLQEAIDNALLSSGDAGTRIKDVLASELSDAVKSAEVRDILRGLGDDIESVLTQGISDGTIIDPATARYVTQGVFDAAVAGLPKDSQAYKDAAAAYEAALEAVTPVVQQIDVTEAKKKMAEDIQTYLDEHPNSTIVEATYQTVLAEKGLSPEARDEAQAAVDALVGDHTVQVPSALKAPVWTDAIEAQFFRLGANARKALAAGFDGDPNQLPNAGKKAVRKLVHGVVGEAQIESPSKVFKRLGGRLMEGFALGIEEGAGRAASAATTATRNAIEAARGLGGISVSANIEGVSPAAFVSQQGRSSTAAQQGLTQGDVVKLAQEIAAQGKPNVMIDQTFNEKVDSRAVASDVAWRLT